jgi:hypothetical protein
LNQERYLHWGDSARAGDWGNAVVVALVLTVATLIAAIAIAAFDNSTRQQVRIALSRLRLRPETAGSRTCDLAGSFATSGMAGNCNTVARWPSHRRVSRTICPSGNSNAS